jgi:ketosteroid isomerase-like protein
MGSDAASWFDLFKAFGYAPSPDSYAAVFHPEGEVADAGAPPVPASQVREAIAHILRLMPDLFIDMKRYRARGDSVFVDAANSATLNGTRVAWDAVYRVRLKEGRVHRGRRFYDQATVFRALKLDMGRLPQLAPSSIPFSGTYADLMPGAPFALSFAAGAHIESPDQRRALTPGDLAKHLVGAPFETVDWAGDDTLAFVEWRHGDLLGVDMLEMKDGAIVSLRRNFDTLGLLAAHDPSVTALRAALLSNAAR